MIRISVVSSDELFASMLCAEIESMGNEYKLVSKNAEILVVDLDSLSEMPEDRIVVGFSRREDLLSADICNKCNIVLHRPFLLDDLKKAIKEACGPNKKEAPLSENRIISDGSLIFDKDSSSVELYGNKIHLSKNEYEILRKLSEAPGAPVSREELCEVLSSSAGNMCDVYICHLRTKLEGSSDKRLIFTVRGKGYMLKI